MHLIISFLQLCRPLALNRLGNTEHMILLQYLMGVLNSSRTKISSFRISQTDDRSNCLEPQFKYISFFPLTYPSKTKPPELYIGQLHERHDYRTWARYQFLSAPSINHPKPETPLWSWPNRDENIDPSSSPSVSHTHTHTRVTFDKTQLTRSRKGKPRG